MTDEWRGIVGDTIAKSVPWFPTPIAAAPGSPNVVVVVLDDVGFADFGCYGSEISTPNIDRVAARGIRYTHFHTTAVCSASRACLLTGRNHHSVGMSTVSNWDTGFPGARGRVSKATGNLAEMIGPAGYGTFAVGKWHLTSMDEVSHAGPYDHWPLRRGFDRFYGFFDGANNWAPSDLVYDNHRVASPDRPGYHLSEDLVDKSMEFIRDQVCVYPEKPFFLYLCFFACHAPYHAPPAYLKRYRGAYERGWDEVREQRLVRQKELGIVPECTTLPPRNPGVQPWSELGADEQLLTSRLYESYAAMLEHTDAQIGRLLDYLERIGKLDDTLLVVTSDNGATREGGALGSVNWYRSANAMPMGQLDFELSQLEDIGGPFTGPVNAIGWSMVGNTPLKRYKGQTHGGGVRDPLVISWPARIEDRGSLRHQFVHMIDLAPTVLDLVSVEPPSVIAGVTQRPIEGASLASTIDDAAAPPPRATQYFEMMGHRGIWHEGWKAVTFHPPGTDFDADVWELYHLDADTGECEDLAAAHPDRLAELIERWWGEARKYNVLPLDDRVLERFLVRRPNPVVDRAVFTYYDGVYIPTEAMPNIRDVSHSITARVQRPTTGCNGVIVACGDRTMGYAMYVKENRLCFHYNAAGDRSHVTGTTEVPPGEVTLRYVFDRTAKLRGIGSLYVNGDKVGEGPIGPTIGVAFSPLGLSIGSSRSSSVTDDYAEPFRFQGAIDTVVIELGDDRGHSDLPPYMND
jgi:arylsulfatase